MVCSAQTIQLYNNQFSVLIRDKKTHVVVHDLELKTGIMKTSNGDVYDGEFKNGKFYEMEAGKLPCWLLAEWVSWHDILVSQSRR